VPATTTKRLTPPQESALLRKHLTGEFGACHWPTVRSLIAGGYLAEVGKDLAVTPKGRAYCDEHHMEMRL
jgi:hypothetical protein